MYVALCNPDQLEGACICRWLHLPRYCFLYFKKQKSEALDKFKKFKATAEKESGIKIKAVRTDRGGEYMSEEFVSYLKQCGIQAKTTAAYSPQQNGVAERLNRTIGEAAIGQCYYKLAWVSLSGQKQLLLQLLRNGMVTTALKTGCTPYQLRFGNWESRLETPSHLWLHSLCPHPRQKQEKARHENSEVQIHCIHWNNWESQSMGWSWTKVLCQIWCCL